MNNSPMDEAALRRKLPFVDFETPVKVTLPEVKGWACRYCVAKHGLPMAEVYATYEEWVEHFDLNHIPVMKGEE